MPKFRGWVVKVGGSLARAPTLPAWITTLATLDVPCIVVPGGGPFTAPTATLQQHWGFADPVAHRMAILGMTQFGLMLAGLVPTLRTVDLATLAAAPPVTGAAVWLPALADVAQMDELPADWRVTSDSIALWLAARLDAAGLVLVKSAAVPAGEWRDGAGLPLVDFAHAGWVDECFPELHARIGRRLVFCHADEPVHTGLLSL